MFIEIFNELLEENGLNRKQFAEKSGFPYTTVIGWTKLNRLPDYSALIKLADFFDCSIDYLAGRQDSYGNSFSPIEASPIEQSLLKNFRKLSPPNKDIIIKLTKSLTKTETKE